MATITQTAANRNELSRKSLSAVGVAHNKSNAHALYVNALSSANRKLPSGQVLKLLPTFACYSILLAFARLPNCCLLLRAALFGCLLESTKVLPTYAGITSENSLELLINP